MNSQQGDPPEPKPYDPRAEATKLLRSTRAGALATTTPEGTPFASLVTVATLPDGSPILLVSRLAKHTRNLEADPRLALLLARSGDGDPLAHPRLTIEGAATCVTEAGEHAAARARFLAKHPRAELYADFADFSFWRVGIERAQLVGGFGRQAGFDAAGLLTPLDAAESLIAAEAGALAHLEADHKDALGLYATVLAEEAPGEWCATGLDPEGLDLACGDRAARIAFPAMVRTPQQLRGTLAELAQLARDIQARTAATLPDRVCTSAKSAI
jgi:putative heme iron utilization protein